jgi:hypothetical protein
MRVAGIHRDGGVEIEVERLGTLRNPIVGSKTRVQPT